MRRLLLSTLFLYSGSVYAQSVLQAGPHTPGRASMYVGTSGQSQAIVQDSGPASGGAVGTGLSELGVTIRGKGTPPYANAGTGPFGANICDYDAPINNPTGYHYICLSANSQGGMSIIAGNGGSAAQLPLQYIINGLILPINNVPSLVNTISNSDGTLTISPISGVVSASLAVGHANTWTAGQIFSGGLTGTLTGHASLDLSIANNLSDVAVKVTAFDNISPMTTAGDIIYGGTTGTGTRLAAGTSAQVLFGGTTPSWGPLSTGPVLMGQLKWGPGTITAQTCSNNTFALVGAKVGLNVATINPPAGTNLSLQTTAIIATDDIATIIMCNPTAGNLAATAGNFTIEIN